VAQAAAVPVAAAAAVAVPGIAAPLSSPAGGAGPAGSLPTAQADDDELAKLEASMTM